MNNIEAKIGDYLKEKGLKRIDMSLELHEIIMKFGGLKKFRKFEKAMKKDKPYEKAKIFELYYSLSGVYDARVAFLGTLVDKLEEHVDMSRSLQIADGGCAIGLDVGFLASLYREKEISFFGYDRKQSMIRKAKKKIGGVAFYRADNLKPKNNEIWNFDILYTNGSVFEEDIRVAMPIMCSRLKPEGIYIDGTSHHESMPEIKGMELVESVKYFEGVKDTYMHIFRMTS